MKIRRWPALLTAFAFFQSCNITLAADAVPYTVLKLPVSESQTPVEPTLYKPWTRVIQTSQQWTEFYNMNFTPLLPVDSEYKQAPFIDFMNYTLIIGGLGGQTGIELVLDRVTEDADSLDVAYLALEPEPGCNVAEGVRFPLMALLVPRTSKTVRFHTRFRSTFYRCE